MHVFSSFATLFHPTPAPGRTMAPKTLGIPQAFPGLPILAFLLAFGSLLPSGVGGQGVDPVDPHRLTALQARSIGPAGMSGRIAAIDAVESDPNVVYVGAATGGLWKSVNGGQTWEPLFDDQEVLGIGSVAVFQADPDIVWVGTGEGNPRNSAGVGAGVFKSTDGGRSWTHLGLKRSERIHRIVLHPSNPEMAWVGVMGPAWSDGEERGVYRTTDGGATWERVLFVNQGTGVSDLVLDPSDPDRLLAGLWEFRRQPWFFESGGPGSGLYRSEDGGDSWTRLTAADGLPGGELGRIGLAVARGRPQTVYALVEADRSALLRSDDGGRSWRTVNDEPGVARRPFYYTDIYVDPANELRIFNLHSRLTRSEDGGESFQSIATGVHPDFHAMWINPSDSREIYLGTDGGVYITRDRGDHWRFVDNLPVAQFYHVSVDREIPFNIYGGMQDNGSWRGPSDLWERGGIRNHHWEEVGFGDGFGTLLDPSDPGVGYSMSQGGGLVRFDLASGARKGIRPWGPDGVELRFNWNAPIAADPLADGTIYYGSQFVHMTMDGGESWQIISGDLTTNDPEKQRQEESGGLTPDHTGAENHTTLVTIAPSPMEDEVLWTGSDDGLVHVTRSSGGAWEEVGHRARDVPEGTWIPHIEASRHGRGTAYVAFDDHRRGSWEPYLFRVEEYGRRWRRIADEDDLRGFVHTLEEDPTTPNLLFVGTEFGLWVSMNGGEDWFRWEHGVPAVPVRSVVVHPRDLDLVVGTHGRSLYVLDDLRPLQDLAADPSISSRPLHLFGPPPAFLVGEGAADGYHFPGDALFRGETRHRGALLTYWVGEEVDSLRPSEATVEILDTYGDVVRTLDGPADAGLNRIVWDLRETSPLGDEASGTRLGREGPEVLPGSYRIRVTAGPHQATTALAVLPDPREDIPLEERIQKRRALDRAREVVRVSVELQTSLDTLRAGTLRLRAQLQGEGEDRYAGLLALADSIRTLTAGLQDALDDANDGWRSLSSMASTRDRPTEADRINLIRAEEAVDRLIPRFNALLAGELEDLRQALQASGLSPMPRVDLAQRRPVGQNEDGAGT